MSSIEDLTVGAKGFKNTWISIEIKGFSQRVLKNHKGLKEYFEKIYFMNIGDQISQSSFHQYTGYFCFKVDFKFSILPSKAAR